MENREAFSVEQGGLKQHSESVELSRYILGKVCAGHQIAQRLPHWAARYSSNDGALPASGGINESQTAADLRLIAFGQPAGGALATIAGGPPA